jgi:acetyl esterase/lipase
MRPANRVWPYCFGLAVTAALFIPLCSCAPPRSHANTVAAEDSKPDVQTTEDTTTYKVKSVKDVVYYDGTDQDKVKHKLDLYLPEGAKNFPVLFFVHGGAWVSGDKNFFGVYAALAKTYVKQGIGVVVTNYRLSPGVKHPEHVKDVARALAWTYKNVGKHGGNPDAITLVGHSAGAHLVSLVTTDASYLKELGLKTNVIKGVVPISGPFDVPDGFLTNVFGKYAQKAAPLRFVREDLPPFLIFYADKDMIGCDKAPSEAFCKALKGKKVTATTVEVKDSNHLDIIARAGTADSEVSKAIIKFVRANAK